MSVREMSEEEKKEIREKHVKAIKADRENRAAMNGKPNMEDGEKYGY